MAAVTPIGTFALSSTDRTTRSLHQKEKQYLSCLFRRVFCAFLNLNRNCPDVTFSFDCVGSSWNKTEIKLGASQHNLPLKGLHVNHLEFCTHSTHLFAFENQHLLPPSPIQQLHDEVVGMNLLIEQAR